MSIQLLQNFVPLQVFSKRLLCSFQSMRDLSRCRHANVTEVVAFCQDVYDCAVDRQVKIGGHNSKGDPLP